MDEVKTILNLIEGVSPDDSDTLDQIDARVWCFVYQSVFLKLYQKRKRKGSVRTFLASDSPNPRALSKPRRYTRSRDALKSIRPEGWMFEMSFTWPDVGNEFTYEAFNRKLGEELDSYGLLENVRLTAYASTEELAELHAIIQAISYERASRHNSMQ